MFLNLTPTPKIAPKDKKSPEGPKKVQKRPKMWPNLKQKVSAVLSKPKLIVYIGRSQKSFPTGPLPEKKPFHFSIFNSEFSNSKFLNSAVSNSEFSKSEFLNSEFSKSESLNCKF